MQDVSVDLADARILRNLLEGVELPGQEMALLQESLAAKDVSSLRQVAALLPEPLRAPLLALPGLYGGVEVLDQAAQVFANVPRILPILDELRWLAQQLVGVGVTFDLADMRGYAYYSGARFSIYAPGASDALVRGGRYDEVGAVFGRMRPAVGFSLDLRELVEVLPVRPLKGAIRAPWGHEADLREAIAGLRLRGEVVVCILPGHESEIDEFHCDRELVNSAGQWVVKSL